MAAKSTIGNYLLQALYRRGVREIFGIPGDFALNFFKAIEQYRKFRLITLSHEPGLGFAADGLSRITGKMAAVAVTYGAGALNIVNSIACAYAEKSPLVVISGAPGIGERGAGILFHHQAKTLKSQQNIFKEVTSYQAILENPETAAEEIEKALQIAHDLATPVYIEIPRDRVFTPLPRSRLQVLPSLPEYTAATGEAAAETLMKIKAARRPVLMVGVEVKRFNLTPQVTRLAEKLQIPVTTSFMGRGVFPQGHPLFAGTYLGPVGDPRVMNLVEKSDCLILLGVLFADTNMALRLHALDTRHVIHAINRQVQLGHHSYDHVPLALWLKELLHKAPARRPQRRKLFHPKVKVNPLNYFTSQPLEVEDIIRGLNTLFYLKGPMPAVADNGDCLFASLDLTTDHLLASGYYATMGFAVPAGMGVQIGSGKRPVVLVGDGAFQMTGPELSHCPRLGLNPIVIIFNNRRWEMLRTIQPEGKYFDLTSWNFAKMAEIWGGRAWRVKTRKEYWEALMLASREKKFCLIDAILPLGKTSKVLQNYLKRIRE